MNKQTTVIWKIHNYEKLIQELVLGEVNFRILDILMTNEATEIYHCHEDATMIDAISEKGSWPAKCTDI